MSDRNERIADAEAHLLSALMWRPDLLASTQPRPRAGVFFSAEGRAIFAAIQAVRAAEPARVEYEIGYGEAATVTRLEALHNGDARRFVDHALAIADVGVPSGAPAYAAILRAEAERSKALRLLAAFHREGEGDVADVGDWLDRIAAETARVAEDARHGELDPGEDSAGLGTRRVREIEEHMDPDSKASPGVLTGLDALDRLLVGFRGGQIVVIAGRPGLGETAFLGRL